MPTFLVNHHNAKNDPDIEAMASPKNSDDNPKSKVTLSLEHAEKFIIGGSCTFKGEERSFICKLSLKVRYEETELFVSHQSNTSRTSNSGKSSYRRMKSRSA